MSDMAKASELGSGDEPRREPTKKELAEVVVASLVGTTIEWYDFFLYGTVTALVFDKIFFPHDNPFLATVLAYTVYALGFVTRPIGGLIFGHYGDRLGRKPLLILTLSIMGISTFLVGIVPTYAQIGAWAPIILLILRLLQGIGLGGEWGGAVLMTFEYGPKEKRGLYAAYPQVGLAIGLCLSTAAVTLLGKYLTDEQFLAWGWRVAFMISIVLVAVGLWVRLKLLDTPSFRKIQEAGKIAKVPLKEVLRDYKGNVLLGWGARMIDGVVFNIYAVFTITYVVSNLGYKKSVVLDAITISAFILIFTIPYAAHLSDKFGRRRVFGLGAIACAVLAFPAFGLMFYANGHDWIVMLCIIIPFGIAYAFVYGPEAALFCELFDTRVRYSGISSVYQVSGILSSSITPLIATLLYAAVSNQPWGVAGYIVAIGILSSVSTAFMHRTFHD